MSSENGNEATNGHGGATLVRIRKLLEFHESNAKALRTTLELLEGAAVAKKKSGAPHALAAALEHEAERAAKRKGPGRPRKGSAAITKHEQPGYHDVEARMERRRKSAAFLEHFGSTPKTASDLKASHGLDLAACGLAALARHGYLKKKGDGWVRTSRPYVP